ncbi:DNA-directed RNA polymerase subunit beta [Bienertia sinuspersici]
MAKRRAKKVGSIGASSNEHIEIFEPQVPEYERLRMLRIKQNESIIKGEQKNAADEDELYKSDEDVDVEDELNYSDEELSIGENSSNPRSKSPVRKFGNLKKRIPKTKALAMAFKKQQQKLHILTRGKRIEAPECEEGNSTASALLCTNETNKENDNSTKPRRGPTMCYKVHERSEEECLEIILNEHGQPIGPDDKTLNEFSSFLGIIARKANLLPLTVKNWPTFKNDKREELWIMSRKSVEKIHNCLVGKDKNIMPTTGPKSFSRAREDWKKERKTARNPTLAEMFIATGKEKRTKRKPGDPRDKFICELEASSSLSTPTSGTKNVVAAIFNSKDNKKCQFHLYGRGVSSTLLKQKAILEEAKKKHDEKKESLQKDYEDKRQQDRQELASSLQSLLSNIQQQNHYMSFDLSMFGSLLLDG